MEWRNERYRDWNALIRAALLLALAAWIIKLVATGAIKWYVNPKFTLFTTSATVGLGLMAFGQLVRGLKSTPEAGAPVRVRLYLALAAVLAMGFLLKPVVFSADLAAKQGLNMTRRSGAAPAAPGASAPGGPAPGGPAPGSPTPGAPTPGSPAPGTPTPGAPAPTAPGGPAPSGEPPLVITAKNFVSTMNAIYFKPEQYPGRRAVIEGFTFNPPDTGPDTFSVIRLVVTCHVAHAAPDGLLTTLPGQVRPPEDQWVRAEGVLEAFDHQGVPTVRLRVEKMTPVEKPEDPYVYP